MRQKWALWIILVLLSLNPAFGQSRILNELESDFLNSVNVGLSLGQRVVHPTSKEFGIFAGLGVLSLFDEPNNRFFQKNHSSFNDAVFRIDRIYGNKNIMIPTVFLIYTSGLLSGQSALRLVGLKSTQAVVYSGLLVVIIKELTGRARPYQELGAYRFKPFSFKERWRSFPSGHAAITFAFSTIMAKAVPNFWWQSLWYSGAVLVAGARMYHNVHWLTDVMAGSLIGWSVANYVWSFSQKKSEAKQVQVSPGFTLFPMPTVCLNLRVKF